MYVRASVYVCLCVCICVCKYIYVSGLMKIFLSTARGSHRPETHLRATRPEEPSDRVRIPGPSRRRESSDFQEHFQTLCLRVTKGKDDTFR